MSSPRRSPLVVSVSLAGILLLLAAGARASSSAASNVSAIVRIVEMSESNPVYYSGSGTIIDREGDILTNYHVIEPMLTEHGYTLLVLLTPDPQSAPFPGLITKIVGYNRQLDLALLRAIGFYDTSTKRFVQFAQNAIRFPMVTFNRSASKYEVSIGDDIQILGYPGAGGDTITFTKGTVSGFEPLDGTNGRSVPWRLKTDAKINHGNSGGAAFDSAGRFIGVPVAFAGGDGNIGFVISLPVVDQFLTSQLGRTDECPDPVNAFRATDGACYCKTGFDWNQSNERCQPGLSTSRPLAAPSREAPTPKSLKQAVVAAILSDEIEAYKEALSGFQKAFVGRVATFTLGRNGQSLGEFSATRPDVVLAVGARAAKAAIQAFPGLPIVYCMVLDPRANGIAGGNVVGIDLEIPINEQLEAFRSTAPRLQRIGVVYDPSKTGRLVGDAQRAASTLGLTLIAAPVSRSDQVAVVLAGLVGQVDGLWLPPDSTAVTVETFKLALELSLGRKLPLMVSMSGFVKAG
ncbi:MAG: ABC transporter substrate binding protein, partial [Deltaproteobacteria bacterium]